MLVSALASLNQILSAGITITAFSLLLYALTFNLRDRVARTFAALLSTVTLIYFCDVVVGTTASVEQAETWLRLQWLGIAFIPVTYLHFSDALLATTGLPSRGRRRFSIRVLYVTASVFVVAATQTDILVSNAVVEANAARLQAGGLFPVFSVFFAGTLGWAAWNFVRAYRRCQTSTTRRRMAYLMSSSVAPALGSFPFLLVAGQTATMHALTFWLLAFTVNLVVTGLLLVMAYVVAYFGVTQPDRIVKARFFQWLLRGPVVVSTFLAAYILIGHYGPQWAFYDSRLLPFVLVGLLLFLQFLITLVRLPIERTLFYGADREELRRLHTLEARLLTSGDLRQFLELVLAGLCDALRTPAAFIATFNAEGKLDYEISVGMAVLGEGDAALPPATVERAKLPIAANGQLDPSAIFTWNDYWVLPLRSPAADEPLGLLGLKTRPPTDPLAPGETTTLLTLAERAATALEDRRLQRDVFAALDRLLPKIEAIQRLRASAYAEPQSLAAADQLLTDPDLAHLVKDALSHYWGGPKLTNSPLLGLRIVERALAEHNGNAVNALRAVLQQAIDRVKPEGQRKFTTEWVLYNILEMKFLQNRRVREIALRLAVSEADLYRKQRLAVEQVAHAIISMEKEAADRATDYEVAG